MGWSGSLNANSAVGAAITFTPDTGTDNVGAYTASSFTAPRKGIYRFVLKGSGGSIRPNYETGASWSAGGTGGYTVGYLLLEAGQTVYIGAGSPCSAAFVSKISAATLAATGSKSNLFFVAGAGGGGGANWGQQWNMKSGPGGAGGGTTGANGSGGAAGGTQTSGLGYGVGGGGGYSNSNNTSFHAGRGGDGLYGGYGGSGFEGGGGGSGYIHATSFKVGSKTYTNTTQQGGGAGSNTTGSVEVCYYARAELPVGFNGTTLEKIIFNGVEIESLIFNGTKLFFERLRKEITAWSMWTKAARFLRALT